MASDRRGAPWVPSSPPNSAVSWSLVAASITALLVALVLAVGQLWETPNTACGRLFSPGPEDPCGDVWSRRLRWVIIVLAVAVLLAALAFVVRTVGWERPRPTALVLLVLMVAVTAGALAAGRLAIGDEECGSTLSRIDEHGEYNPNKPNICAPRYDDAKADAWLLGTVAVGLLVAVPIGAGITAWLEWSRRPRPAALTALTELSKPVVEDQPPSSARAGEPAVGEDTGADAATGEAPAPGEPTAPAEPAQPPPEPRRGKRQAKHRLQG